MKTIIKFFISSILFISCTQAKTPKQTLIDITKIAQKESLTLKDYHDVVDLVESSPRDFEKFLEKEGIAYEVKVLMLDAIYEEIFINYNDTSALQRRIGICEWTQNNYPANSKEIMIAESRLVEIYTLFKKYDQAIKQLNTNISHCKAPSLDHATCIYTKGWMEQQMGKKGKALTSLKESYEEYETLRNLVNDILEESTLSEEQRDFFEKGKEEANRGLEDCLRLINEIRNMN